MTGGRWTWGMPSKAILQPAALTERWCAERAQKTTHMGEKNSSWGFTCSKTEILLMYFPKSLHLHPSRTAESKAAIMDHSVVISHMAETPDAPPISSEARGAQNPSLHRALTPEGNGTS